MAEKVKVIDSIFVKDGENFSKLFISALAEYIIYNNQSLSSYLQDSVQSDIESNQTEIQNIKASLGNLLSTDNSVSKTISDIQKEITNINTRYNTDSILPAKFVYDKGLGALKLTFVDVEGQN